MTIAPERQCFGLTSNWGQNLPKDEKATGSTSCINTLFSTEKKSEVDSSLLAKPSWSVAFKYTAFKNTMDKVASDTGE